MRLRRSHIRGSAMLLVIISISVIVGILALAVDLNLALNASTDQQQLSNVLASGALKAYLESSVDASGNLRDFSARKALMLARAEEISARVENRPFYQGLLSDPDDTPTLCLHDDSRSHCQLDTNIGTIIPGNWFYEEPNGVDPCAGQYPCFKPNFEADSLNAVQIELRQSDSAPLRTVFARLLGFESLRTSAHSTAAVVPRQIAFVVDLSGSVAGETHLKDPSDNAFNKKVAYKLASGFDCSDAAAGNLCDAATSTCPGILASADPFSLDKLLDENWWNTPNVRPGGPFDSTLHAKSEYRCFSVASDGEEDGSAGPANYLVDTFQNTPEGYFGPEPLTSILRAIHEALEVMEDTAQPGDGVIFVGFDRTLLDNRIIPAAPRDAGGNRVYRLARVGDRDPDFRRLKAITDVEHQDAAFVDDPSRSNLEIRIEDHALFPRINPFNSDVRDSGIWTNLRVGLFQAYQALMDNSSADYADRELVVFSDFISNCSASSWEEDPRQCAYPQGGEWEAGCCGNDGQNIMMSVATYWMDSTLSAARVHFNPILFGQYALPHTRLLSDGNGGCLLGEDDEEVIRSQSSWPSSYTDWNHQNCPPGNSGSCTLPNTYVHQAHDTGGVWGVIRPCCKSGGACANVVPQLESACAGNTEELYAPFPVLNPVRLTDTSARITCDPEGRDPMQQMRQYMLDVMKTNPIRLVGPTPRLIP